MRWLLWAAMLALTQGSGTLASRARNTNSFAYHGCAALFSHSCFFVAQLVGLDLLMEVIKTLDYVLAIKAFAVYAAASTGGSVLMHWLAIKFFENDQRRVGGY